MSERGTYEVKLTGQLDEIITKHAECEEDAIEEAKAEFLDIYGLEDWQVEFAVSLGNIEYDDDD